MIFPPAATATVETHVLVRVAVFAPAVHVTVKDCGVIHGAARAGGDRITSMKGIRVRPRGIMAPLKAVTECTEARSSGGVEGSQTLKVVLLQLFVCTLVSRVEDELVYVVNDEAG